MADVYTGPPPKTLIAAKLAGNEWSDDQVQQFVDGVVLPSGFLDAQLGAALAALHARGMTDRETSILTQSMMRSGDTLDFRQELDGRPFVDKHCTGGVGDKVSHVLAPVLATLGMYVPMISGRGLDHTGGTLDKLEAISGYRCDLTEAEILRVLQTCGCTITGQTGDLVPADRRMYAMRDATGTVDSIPLIVASIMSKKLAEGLDYLMLDVKVGRAAFMKERQDALKLARGMVEAGKLLNVGTAAVLTDMNVPIGHCVGNALEIIEALQVLQGEGPADLQELCLTIGGRLMTMCGKAEDQSDAESQIRESWKNGSALETFRSMVQAHKGDLADVDAMSRPDAIERVGKVKEILLAPRSGFVSDVDALAVGEAGLLLGAGRQDPKDEIDHQAGLSGIARIGTWVNEGEPLLTLHAAEASRMRAAMDRMGNAFVLQDSEPPRHKRILDLVE